MLELAFSLSTAGGSAAAPASAPGGVPVPEWSHLLAFLACVGAVAIGATVAAWFLGAFRGTVQGPRRIAPQASVAWTADNWGIGSCCTQCDRRTTTRECSRAASPAERPGGVWAPGIESPRGRCARRTPLPSVPERRAARPPAPLPRRAGTSRRRATDPARQRTRRTGTASRPPSTGADTTCGPRRSSREAPGTSAYGSRALRPRTPAQGRPRPA